MTGNGTPRLLDAGEAALVVEFGSTVDPAVSDRVLALDNALAADRPAGITETVPTYRSLMIHYDPLTLDRETLAGHVRGLTGGTTGTDVRLRAHRGHQRALLPIRKANMPT